MPRQPGPVRPRIKDERIYEAALRRAYLDPIFKKLRTRLQLAQSAAAAERILAESSLALAVNAPNVPEEIIEENLEKIRAYHRARMTQAFRAALGVDIRLLLQEAGVQRFMAQKIVENVDLIRTIPPRMHDSLKKRLQAELLDAPFDQQRLTNLLRNEYKSSGYNLRRIVRDQNSKTIGGLTEIRQRQLGLEGYQWITSQDERVRPTHVANSGRYFLWSSPPATGHPGQDIQCRCTASPVVSQAARERIQASGAHIQLSA